MTDSYDAKPYVSGDPYADYRRDDHAFTGLVDLADRRSAPVSSPRTTSSSRNGRTC